MQSEQKIPEGILMTLKSSKTEILTMWMEDPKIIEIFKRYKISRYKFKPLFAEKVFDYSIGVLDGTKEIGNCPVMNKFVDYMCDKDITVKDVLQICMAFRRSIFRRLVSKGELPMQDTSLLERLSEVFDENLSGVLDYINQLYLDRELQTQRMEDTQESVRQIQTVLNLQESMILTVKEGKLFLANRAFFHALDLPDIEAFHTSFPDTWSFIESVDLHSELFQKKKYADWLQKVAGSEEQKATITFFNQALHQSKSYQAKIIGMPDSEKKSFAIRISEPSTEYDKKMTELSRYVYTDPLTTLYNRRKFDESIHALVGQFHSSRQDFSLIVMDLDDLNRINQMYGRERGDTILKELGQAIDEKFGKLGIFARIDGDRFGLLLKSYSLEESNKTAKSMLRVTRTLDFGLPTPIKCNFAVLHCQKNDTELTLFKRADILLKDIIKGGSDAIKDDQALIKEEHQRKKLEASFLVNCIELKAADETLVLVNYFQEVPIQSKSKILHIRNGTVTMTMRNIAIKALNKGASVYIHAPEGDKNIKARVSDFNEDKNMITLDNFQFLEASPLNRKTVHVKTEEKIKCFIKMNDTQIQGTLGSLSTETAMIFLPHVYDISMDGSIILDTTLSWEGQKKHLQITGKIKKIIEMEEGFKVIIHMDQGKKIDDIVLPYVAHRQLEIIRALQHPVS